VATDKATRPDGAAAGSTSPDDEILVFPVSFAQRRLWFLEKLHPGGTAYNVPFALRARGSLRPHTFRQALTAAVARHESLRTTFATIDGEPVQVVTEAQAPVPLPVIDLGGLSPALREAAAKALAAAVAEVPFDLRRGPLLRTVLLRLAPDDHLVPVVLHHIVCDGWSMGLLLRQVIELYRAFAAGRPSPLPPPALQYPDFAVWQRERLAGDRLERQLDYWRSQLGDAPPLLALPTDRPRGAGTGFAGRTRPFTLPAEVTAPLQALAREAGATLFMVLLAAFSALLSRWSGQDDLVLGTPVANRDRRELEGLVGFLVNTLALRVRPRPAGSLRDLVGEVRRVVLDGQAHQDLPFERLVEELQPERSVDITPVFQVLFAFEPAARGPGRVEGLELSAVPITQGATKFDLTLRMGEGAEGLAGSFQYRSALFDDTTIARLANRFADLVTEAARHPDRPLDRMHRLEAAERHQLLVEWGGPPLPAGRERTVPGRFARRVAEHPDRVAVVADDEWLTFAALDRRSAALAGRLRAAGVGPEVTVGLCLERSVELIVGLVAVVRAGGAYVPLDPALPAARLEQVLDESAAPVVVTRSRLRALLPSGRARAILVDDPGDGAVPPPTPGSLEAELAPANLLYVLFTSGSTGRPRGVGVENRQLVDYVDGLRDRLGLPDQASYATVSTVAADLGNTAIFPALLGGGTLHVVSDERLGDPAAMVDYFRRRRIDCLKAVPSYLASLRTEGEPAGVLPERCLVLGGEASYREDAEGRGDGSPEVFNHYGPTEATVGAVAGRVVAEGPSPGSPSPEAPLPLGRPLAGRRIELLDPALRPVARGAVGELCLAGAGLARGYLGRPADTAAKFVPDSHGEPGERLYRTGDLARHRPDGVLEFLGRLDHQVKVRGFRVEVGEVEAALCAHPAVAEAVAALDRGDGGDGGTGGTGGRGGGRLVAWLVPRVEAELPAAGELRRFLAERLPGYMVPAFFVPVEALPLTAQGKVDRSRLPAPDGRRGGAESEYVAPRNRTEERLVELWREILGVERVGVEDGFFELGGHSLLATRLGMRIRKAFGVELPLRVMFETPTVEGMAGAIAGGVEPDRPAKPTLRRTSRAAHRVGGTDGGEGS